MQKQKANKASSLTVAIVITALIIASALSYHEYLVSRNISFQNVNFTANTIGSYCAYGHICGIPSNGCAVPGDMYNCPMIPANLAVNAIVSVDL